MKPVSKNRYYQISMVLVLLTLTNGCKKEVPELKQDHIPIVTTDVTDISTTSVNCVVNIISCESWSNPSNFQGRHGICWSNINTEPTLYGNSDGSISEECSFSIMLEYLTPGTTYYVRAFAENMIGVGYGNVVEFSTSGSMVGNIQFNPDLIYGSVTDNSGNTYKTIKAGSQTWMAENLKTSEYNDGTDIPHVSDQTEWVNLTTPGYCWYLNDESKYKDTFGALYNWYTVKTGKLCPSGWHVPDNEEWESLSLYLGETSVAGNQLRETGITHWVTTNMEITNSSGFTALPGGSRNGFIYEPYPDLDYFINLGYAADFWSSGEQESLYGGLILGISWYIYFDNAFGNYGHEKSAGLSVRCIQD